MLNRVINDIFQLRRVHSILPDAVLGDTLKNKLLRLSLQPSLQQLKHARQQHLEDVAGSSTPPATSSLASSSGAGSGVAESADLSGSAALSPYTIEPSALCHLLDSLAYFHLGTSAVAKEAVQLVQLSAPTMSAPHLCTTLAACCAMGAQHDITATALPLLNTALTYYTGAPSREATATDSPSLLFSQGANVVLLIEALQKAGVREKEVWHLLAEHCLRYLEAFDGRQLCSIVNALCVEGIDDYPDFFVAAERHITSQSSNYLSADLLQQVVQCYKELNQPVVSLLAAINAIPQHEEDLDRSISAAAAVAALSGTPHRPAAEHAYATSSFDASTSSATASSASVQRSLVAFESAAITALRSADAQAVLELLRKCERQRVMTARVMDTVLKRLLELYYPALLTEVKAEEKAKASAPGTAAPPPAPSHPHHLPLEMHQLTQSLLIALEFNDASLFVPVPPEKLRPQKGKQPSRGDAGVPPGEAVAKGTFVLTVLLNAVGGELTHWYHLRLLQMVPYAVKLLPPFAHPQTFFRALVAHLRRSSDLSSHEGPNALRFLIEALLALRPYGGEAALVAYMPALTVAVLNAPRTSQLELTARVAQLPCAAKELVPGVYRQWGSQKRWLRTITEDEVESALRIMARSGLRDSPLLHAVIEFVQAQRDQLPPQRVVDYLHQLARLGVRDLELFTHTAEHLMRRTAESSPSLAAAKHQQWQVTTVHDLALLLYTFTFVLRDSIRVTQQIIARLKMCSSTATPRDISLALYSFVKLRVARNDEVAGQLCERAAATLTEFTASELASVWSSLRCLHHPHPKLRQKTLELLDEPALHGEEDMTDVGGAGRVPAARPVWRFSDADCLSLGSALLLTESAPLNLNHPLVRRRDALDDGDGDAPSLQAAAAHSSPLTPVAVAARHVVKDPLPAVFERRYIEVCRRLLPSASGQRLYLILCSLACCDATPNLALDAWETVLKLVDTHAESLTTGRLGEMVGMAQMEVLAALRLVHRHVADVDALRAADAVRADSTNWPTPYCPPGVWAVLRPRWRELIHSSAVQASSSLTAVVSDMKGGGVSAGVLVAEVQRSRATRKAPLHRKRKA